MSRVHRTSTACLAILILLALAACSDLTAPPSPTSVPSRTPTPAATPSPTPTRAPPTATLPPTAPPGPFRENAFPVQRIDESLAQAGIDFDPAFTPLASGTYLFYITALKPEGTEAWHLGTVGIELRYVSLDATSRGRILSVQTQPDLLILSNDLQVARLLMAWFDEQGATVRELDLLERTMRTWQAAGLSKLYPDRRLSDYNVEISTEPRRHLAHHAFSPDGRWLLWDCELGGAVAWCLFDLKTGAAHSVEPCGQRVAKQEDAGRFNWSPASDRFLAYEVYSPGTDRAPCLASLKDRTVKRFGWPPEYRAVVSEQDFGRHAPADYLWSPEGDRLFALREGDLQTGEGGAIYVVSADCIFGGPCDPGTLVRWPYDIRGLFSTTFSWSPTVSSLALAEQPLAASGLGSGPRTSAGVLDLRDGQTRIVTDFAPAAAELRGWSPDGRWMVLLSLGGIESKHILLGLSSDGILRGLVPTIGAGGFGFIGFAGWWVIP